MNLKDQSRAIGHAEPFTVEQNDEVYKRLVSGDTAARDEMIEGNVALAVYRADAYLRSAPQMSYYRDDMIAAGLLGLCEAVTRMQKRGAIKNPKPTGCIAKAIDRKISNMVDEANTIVVPYQAQALARAEGKPLVLPKTVSDKALVNADDSSFRDRQEVLEVKDEALACCKDDIERQIVTMRVDGYTDAQIAGKLRLARQTVSRIRQEIFKRFNERCPEYRETERAKAKRLEKEAAAAAKRAAKKAAKGQA